MKNQILLLAIVIIFQIDRTTQHPQNPLYRYSVRNVEPQGSGYDLFYYDGYGLRDEKWRIDPTTGHLIVNRRHGFRDNHNFHIVDSILNDRGGYTTKSYIVKENVDRLIADGVRDPANTYDRSSNSNDHFHRNNIDHKFLYRLMKDLGWSRPNFGDRVDRVDWDFMYPDNKILTSTSTQSTTVSVEEDITTTPTSIDDTTTTTTNYPIIGLPSAEDDANFTGTDVELGNRIDPSVIKSLVG